METNQLNALLEVLEDIKSNTSDIYDVKNEIDTLGKAIRGIKQSLDENNELLRELIDAVYSIKD
ncbi:hypothetical protein FO440_08240 [Mucilaginibacter corticis]|uniref:Uncharacterized protein n=1 Tax=Mucilaginibacter corticis TaxID=2597670 RepID=A0A556MW56_9SPHI|nr:hypothetical protein [Mucilaginibacter corticis]TSJ44147.1 hypothetical protein FO440_08240 [Mucilaginibacter corticis]